MRALRPISVCLAVGVVLALGQVWGPALAGADMAVELVHPQSDDQGNYVVPQGRSRITVFGLVSPAGDVAAVTVNGRKAELHPAEAAPYGASAGTKAVEFRATVALKSGGKITVKMEGVDGEIRRAEFVGNTKAAAARIKALAGESPDDVRARCRLGNSLKDQGKHSEAAAELRGLLEGKEACISTRVTLGKTLVAMGLPEEGMKEFALATEADAGYAMGWLNLGLVHARFTRNQSEAVRCFKKYLVLEPDSSIADKIERYIEVVGG